MTHSIYKDMQEENSKIKRTKILEALETEDLSVTFTDPLDNEMVLNMGPQHPATHGVLRCLISLEGETIKKCVLDLGYPSQGI